MRNKLSQQDILYGVLWLLILLALAAPRTAGADTLETRYPGLAAGMLKSAVLAPLAKDTLLVADGLTITRSQLLEGIRNQEPKLRAQLEKNLFFVLEQEAMRQVLLSEARKAGVSVEDKDDSQAIQALFEQKTKDLSVSEKEALDFYETNNEKEPKALDDGGIGRSCRLGRIGNRPIAVFFRPG